MLRKFLIFDFRFSIARASHPAGRSRFCESKIENSKSKIP